ncbi:MAG: NAD-dependent succinate-semialdehyde dehydrogenase [Ktedonobacteraceae bacterium]|nr:NAD-dependent succinate-semialdehyde dehydrogenase [Ktedonobacteraceae bacterium]
MTIYSINPATEEVLAEFNEFTPEQIDMALREARQAFEHWRTTSFEERAEPVRRAATYLRQHKPRLARLITEEMGKPITEAEAEIEKCAWNCEFYAQHASRFLADEPVATNARESFVAFEPLGVVLAIMPWNFPFWQVFRFAAPALMAGNAAVLKHASNVPQCALAIEEVFRAAGFPQGVFRTLLVPAQAVEGIIKHRHVAAVTLTGSETVGSMVARTAGEALKKTVLELGGSDPFIVLADADLDKAVEFAVRSRFQNTGQSCIAAKRFIVVEKIADTFEHRFAEAAGRLRVGDPMKRETQVGPMARGDLRTGLDQQVRDSVQQGAQVLQGGIALDGSGYFYAPTILANVQPTMAVFQEETFGPVAAIVRVQDAEEAIAVANHSIYGLGGNVWTGDIERGKQLARRIESGGVFINGMTASDPRLPFGGVKHSGYGRELSSFGIREFVNIQTIWVGPAQ